MKHKWTVNNEDVGSRLLSFIKKRVDAKTTEIRFSIEHQGCCINQKNERFCSRKLRLHEVIEFSLESKPTLVLKKGAVLFEDEHLLIYAKPARLTSEALAEEFKLELVHRLDRDTTGCLLFAKDATTRELLEKLFREREVEKSYLAIVHGRCAFEKRSLRYRLALKKRLPGKVIWGVAKEGALAITDVIRIKSNEHYSYLRLHPKTGRTHQLRVSLHHMGHPIVGDMDYGIKESAEKRPLLHASEISFIHPHTQEKVQVIAPLPKDFKDRLSF